MLFILAHTFAVHRVQSFVPAFFKVCFHLITYLIKSSLKKETIVLDKRSGKSLEIWIQKSV